MFNIFNFIRNLFRKREEKQGTGLIKSPTDYRDIPLSAIKKEFAPKPDKYKIPYILTVSNQGNSPYCVGYVCAILKEFLERREGNNIKFDGDWIYRKCKEIDEIPNFRGTYYRAGLKVLQKFGAKPLGGKEEDAEIYRIGGYVKVDTDFKSLKQAIYEFGVILMGFYISNQGWITAFVRRPRSGEKIFGHAVAGIGYEITFISGQNSWGERWGDKGLFRFTKDYSPIEAWAVLVDLPNNWKELLGEGKPKPKHFFEKNLYHALRGDEIKTLQDCLKYLGCFPKDTESTGNFYSVTLKAVKLFQSRYGIPNTGYVGIMTRSKLNELFAH